MKKYNFLFKPVFYIFSLLFATWLVIRIEKIRPSDFGEPKTTSPQDNSDKIIQNKKYLKNLFSSYTSGLIDSTELDQKITTILKSMKGSL